MPPRPENVLKRAEELVAMGKDADALDLLYDTILSRRTRSAAVEYIEPIVLRFVDLAVELRRGKVLKDGLHQYRKLVVPATPASLDTIVQRVLNEGEAKVAEAQGKAEALADADDDLEAEQSPQDVLMATVSSEQSRDRADREVVTPWLKFLWESYRSVLDVLRNNARLEDAYARVSSQAIAFCVRYARKTEFRRLCELLRTHLQAAAAQARIPLSQLAPGAAPVNLSDPDTLQRFLDARFEQLHAAVKLELWQEAFRSVEDVHTLLTASRRPIRIQNMATYYETLARICAVGGNHLFHAAAWAKYYSMVHATRHSAPAGELERIASFLVLSVLCIPPNTVEDPSSARTRRWTALLNLSRMPDRQALIDAAISKNVLSYARPEIRDLYLLVEQRFHPLTLGADLAPIAEDILSRKVYTLYLRPLWHVLATRVITELAQMYSVVSLEKVVSLCTLPIGGSAAEVERLLVTESYQGSDFHAHVDHRAGSVEFVPSLNVPSAPGSVITHELEALAQCLSVVVPTTEEVRTKVLKAAQKGLQADYEDALRLQKASAKREEEVQAEEAIKEQQAAKERAAKLAEQQAAEARRLANETRERELKRIAKEQAAVDLEFKRKLAQDINSKGVVHVDMKQLDKMTQEDLQRIQIEQLDRESRDLRSRMRGIARRYDHLERAHRREEAKLWHADAAQQIERDRKVWEARRDAVIASARQRFEEEQIASSRFGRMLPAYRSYAAETFARLGAALDAKRAENSRLLEEAKAQRIREVEEARAREEEARRREEERLEAQKAERERHEQIRREAEEARKAAREAALQSARQEPARPSPFGAAARTVSPFGAARPAESRPVETRGASPFGAARPAATGPGIKAASPFGAAKPVDSSGPAAKPASPFGAAKPASTAPGPRSVGTSPFGASRPTSTGPGARPVGASPFGGARPTTTGSGAKPSPFGNARPASTTKDSVTGPKPSPFGNAKPAGTRDSPAPTRGTYVPPSKRK